MKMQKLASALMTGVVAVSMLPLYGANIFAASAVAINATNFPDANFRSYVSKQFDKNSDKKLSADEIKKATYISVYNKSISNLKGIEFFTEATSISAGTNSLTSVNLSKNTKLQSLDLEGNKLKSIDLSKNVNLKNLYLYKNQITSIDLSKNTKLEYIELSSNKLSKINVTKNTALKQLFVEKNLLSSIDVSKNTNLIYLDVFNNAKLAKIDVSKNSKLMALNVGYTMVSSLNLKANKNLEFLQASGSRITKLDLTANSKMVELYVNDTKLSSLNVSKNLYLEVLDLRDMDNLKSIDVSKNKELHELKTVGTAIPKLNIANCALLVATYREGKANIYTYSKYYSDEISGKYCYLSCDIETQIVISNPTKTPSKACIAFVERMYTTAMKRKAEAGGRDYWSKELCSHRISGEVVGAFFFMSDEMVSYKLSDSEYVNRLYATFMDRKPDADGKKYWLDFLKQGHSRLEVVMGFTRSPEFIQKCEDAGILPY